MSILEIIGFITGIIGVWLTAKGNVLCWPVGIINVFIYSFIFYDVKLFGDMWLQIFYLVMGIIGWYNWSRTKTESTFIVNKLVKKEWIGLCIAGVIFFACLTYVLTIVKGSLPWIDGLTTSLSLLATWLTVKKKFENWHLWIVTDLIYTGMYLNKALYLTALLYFIFTILAVYGLFEWKKKLQ